MNLVTWLLERLKERSTWIGIISIITAAGVNLSPEMRDTIITAGMSIVGAILAFTSDTKPVVIVPSKDDIKTQLATAISEGDYAKVAVLAAELANK